MEPYWGPHCYIELEHWRVERRLRGPNSCWFMFTKHQHHRNRLCGFFEGACHSLQFGGKNEIRSGYLYVWKGRNHRNLCWIRYYTVQRRANNCDCCVQFHTKGWHDYSHRNGKKRCSKWRIYFYFDILYRSFNLLGGSLCITFCVSRYKLAEISTIFKFVTYGISNSRLCFLPSGFPSCERCISANNSRLLATDAPLSDWKFTGKYNTSLCPLHFLSPSLHLQWLKIDLSHENWWSKTFMLF